MKKREEREKRRREKVKMNREIVSVDDTVDEH